MNRSIPAFAQRLFFAPGVEDQNSTPLGTIPRIYALRQAAAPEEHLPSDLAQGVPPFARLHR